MAFPYLEAAPPPIVRQVLEKDTDGWVVGGEGARLERMIFPATADAPAQPTLAFDYAVDGRSLGVLALPVAPGAWTRASRVSFTLRASRDTTVVISVQEKGGGRWSAVARCPKHVWQPVRLNASDFQLSRDAGSPADPDERLDLGAVEQVTLLDFEQMAVRAEGSAKGLFPVVPGPRTLWLRDFTVEQDARDIDGLAAPHLGWLEVGGATLAKVESGKSPLGERSLKVDFSVEPGKVAGALRPLPESTLAGVGTLRTRFSSSDPISLVLMFEDAAGGKFTQTIELPGANLLRTVDIALEKLTKAEDSKTDRIDGRRIRQVLLLDLSGMSGGPKRFRTVWTSGWEPR